jgi:hypothetical protein
VRVSWVDEIENSPCEEDQTGFKVSAFYLNAREQQTQGVQTHSKKASYSRCDWPLFSRSGILRSRSRHTVKLHRLSSLGKKFDGTMCGLVPIHIDMLAGKPLVQHRWQPCSHPTILKGVTVEVARILLNLRHRH